MTEAPTHQEVIQRENHILHRKILLGNLIHLLLNQAGGRILRVVEAREEIIHLLPGIPDHRLSEVHLHHVRVIHRLVVVDLPVQEVVGNLHLLLHDEVHQDKEWRMIG